MTTSSTAEHLEVDRMHSEAAPFDAGDWLERFVRAGGMYCVRSWQVFFLQPEAVDLSAPLFELEANLGKAAVFALIRSREAMEVADGHA